jgi:hypothetical protein
VPLMFLTGDGMRGGRLHHHIAEAAALVGERRTLPRYRFYSIRDEYPALCPVPEGGAAILGELYEVPMAQLNGLLAREPPELELSIVALAPPGPSGAEAPPELSFGMVLRSGEHGHADITSHGGWRAYRGQSAK